MTHVLYEIVKTATGYGIRKAGSPGLASDLPFGDIEAHSLQELAKEMARAIVAGRRQ